MDDILITRSFTILIQNLVTKLHATFALKYMGTPNYFLGLEVHYQSNGSILLTQANYISGLLWRAKMFDCKGVDTPMAYTNKLSKHGCYTFRDPHLSRSIVGALQYITLSSKIVL